MDTKTAICIVAEGAEEIEVVVTVDILRRAGIEVTVASSNDRKCVKCTRGIDICTDARLSDVKNNKFDAVILPGGAVGWKNLVANDKVGEILKTQEANHGIIAAICAAPNVLKAYGIAKGKRLTSYPLVEKDLVGDYQYIADQIVVIDDNLITSQGPATTFAFGLAIVEKLLNKEEALKVAKALLYNDYK